MTDHRTEVERLLADSVRHTDTGDIRDAYIATVRSGQSSASALLAIHDLLDERLPQPRNVDPDVAARNLAAFKHEAGTPMNEHGECCEPAPDLAEWYATVAGPAIHEGQSVTVTFKGTYLGYDADLGHHHIEGQWEGVEHLPAYVERIHWAAGIKTDDAPASTESDAHPSQAPADPPTPERPSGSDSDEALAKAIHKVDDSNPYNWPYVTEARRGEYRSMARAAREHLAAESTARQSRANERLYERVEQAEAERDNLRWEVEQHSEGARRAVNERDGWRGKQIANLTERIVELTAELNGWKAKHAALRADVGARGPFGFPALERVVILDRDAARAKGEKP